MGEQTKITLEERNSMLAAMEEIPPAKLLSRCTTPDQLAVFNELRARHLNLKGLLEDYFSGVPYREIHGISKLEQKILKAELEKMLTLYDLLWWEWGEITRTLESKRIYLQDMDVFSPGDAVSKVAELDALATIQHWTSGYKYYSQKGRAKEKAFLNKAFKLMNSPEELRIPERKKLQKASQIIKKTFEKNPGKKLEFILTAGARLVAEEEGRKSPTKRRHKRYMEASNRWLKLVRPHASKMKSHSIIGGQLSFS